MIASTRHVALGAWLARLVGASIPNSRLRRSAQDVEAGKILLMVVVRPGRIAQVRHLVRRCHPEAASGAIE
jgi:hypothetical protein